MLEELDRHGLYVIKVPGREGGYVRVACETCHGTGSVICKACFGLSECPVCRGVGVLPGADNTEPMLFDVEEE